jgi:HK97 family phage major capsid protein
MFMSKAMRQLLSDQSAAKAALSDIVAKSDAKAEDIQSATDKLHTINAKIEAQKGLDAGKEFNEHGVQIVHSEPVPSKASGDKRSSMEYRQAFMDYVKKGVSSNLLDFHSADQSTATSDVGAVIPSTILQEVIKKVESYGQVYAQVRKLAVRGGLTVPILSVKPVATWISENTTSDKQKTNINDKVTFNYYGLECKIATSIVADTVTIDQFESIMIQLIGEAITKALDIAIVSGPGSGAPLGITKDPRVTSLTKHVVTLSSSDFQDWSAWKKKVFAALSASYKAGATFLMASGTFEGYIDGMTDANGQPIGRINYGIVNAPQESFGGKTIIEVEDDVIANYDDAAVGDVVAIYGNLNNYAINSNMSMTMFRYLDQTTNEYVDKAILIADGKTLDANAFVIVKKGA